MNFSPNPNVHFPVSMHLHQAAVRRFNNLGKKVGSEGPAVRHDRNIPFSTYHFETLLSIFVPSFFLNIKCIAFGPRVKRRISSGGSGCSMQALSERRGERGVSLAQIEFLSACMAG